MRYDVTTRREEMKSRGERDVPDEHSCGGLPNGERAKVSTIDVSIAKKKVPRNACFSPADWRKKRVFEQAKKRAQSLSPPANQPLTLSSSPPPPSPFCSSSQFP
mmetsp:Transcript_12866/g.42645  ORF Transcript_12866/g.42645 Transcript_12866/m.42645 type:complete len:104 (-) Transcript_12866:510-821(-)